MSRPPFSIDEFVRARRAFDDGRGPPEVWVQMNEIAWWRLDGLAQRAGSRAWSVLVAPVEPGPGHDGVPQRLHHAVRSAGLGNLSLPAVWRLNTDRVVVSRVMVVFGIDAQRAVRLARRYGQVGVVCVQRIPFEQIGVLDLVGEQRVEVRRYEPSVIADALVRMVGAAAVAVVYRATSFGESVLIHSADLRDHVRRRRDG